MTFNHFIVLLVVGKWSFPEVTGKRPPPCSAFTLTMVDGHRAVLYGGCKDVVPFKHVYVLDIKRMVSAMQSSTLFMTTYRKVILLVGTYFGLF